MKNVSLPLLLMLFLPLTLPSLATGARQDESQVKAVFVLNFAKLTQWPAGAHRDNEPFTIAILGRIPSAAFMATLTTQQIYGLRPQVRHIKSAAEARGSHLVYISPSERQRVSAILRELRQQNILTVSDIDGFCEAGGMIGLVPIQNRLGFEINLGAVRQAQLTVSSQLLKLARTIHGH
jgi:hypothetical protein